MKNIPLPGLNKLFGLVFLGVSTFLSVNQSFAQDYKLKTIVVDAGHGGKDGATHGEYSTEKAVALQVALKLGKAIEEKLPGVRVVYTRTEDVFVPLYERIGLANKVNADLFISIHCNDMPLRATSVITGYKTGKGGKRIPIRQTTYRKSTSTRGTETFVSGSGRLSEQDEVIKRENAAMLLEKDYQKNYEGLEDQNPENDIIVSLMKKNNRVQSLRVAKFMQDEYVKVGRVNRGVQEKSLAVLARAGMPAVLTEIGFISNPEEEEYMNSTEGQDEIVNCLVNAVKSYQNSVETKAVQVQN
ncbi:N-acetylmuramoyl-L-alanine amidase [Pedobacter sp. SYP-B3415]|uniref:N-acetylmuramoyl-L-alanine amidase family protein n=1 Tax=Pedobacter sp. SYP-B3415 TaxID=2496641 RepID=UPI001F10DF7C|nr:N-acetylmuramoyl-L-alanine amidase [Pedobacter sp. SYP-B3415]